MKGGLIKIGAERKAMASKAPRYRQLVLECLRPVIRLIGKTRHNPAGKDILIGQIVDNQRARRAHL